MPQRVPDVAETRRTFSNRSGPAPKVLGMRYQHLIVAVGAILPWTTSVDAQQCDTVSSRTSMSAFAGARIRSVRVVTEGPPGLPGVARALDNLHVRTREATVR